MATNKISLAGKTVLITGATSGLGEAAALHFAKCKAKVLIACRNEYKGWTKGFNIRFHSGNEKVYIRKLDLSSFQSVKCCADRLIKEEEKIDVLINNAGITGVPYMETKDEHDIVIQSNYLGHFMFTHLLLDLLKQSAPSRIINVASNTYKFSNLDVENLNNKSRKPFHAYSNSKLANILFTKELAKRLEGTGVTVNSIHPGVVKTNLSSGSPQLERMMVKMFHLFAGQTAEEAAKPIVNLAVDPAFANVSGKYFEKSKECAIIQKFSDDALAKQLFENSEKIIEKHL